MKQIVKKVLKIMDLPVKEYVKLQFFCILLMLIYSFCSLVYPRIISNIIDYSNVNLNSSQIIHSLFLLSLSTILMVLVQFLKDVYVAHFSNKIMVSIKENLYKHLQKTNGLFWSDYKIGDIFNIIQTDVSSLDTMLTLLFGNVLSNLVILSGVLIYIYIIDLYIGLGLTLLALLFIWMQHMFGKQIQQKMTDIRSNIGDQAGFLNETLNNINSINVSGYNESVLKKYHYQNKKIVNKVISMVQLTSFSSLLGRSFNLIAVVAIISIGIYKINAGKMTLGTLFNLFIYVQQMYNPMQSLINE